MIVCRWSLVVWGLGLRMMWSLLSRVESDVFRIVRVENNSWCIHSVRRVSCTYSTIHKTTYKNVRVHWQSLRHYHKTRTHACYRQDEMVSQISHMRLLLQEQVSVHTTVDLEVITKQRIVAFTHLYRPIAVTRKKIPFRTTCRNQSECERKSTAQIIHTDMYHISQCSFSWRTTYDLTYIVDYSQCSFSWRDRILLFEFVL